MIPVSLAPNPVPVTVTELPGTMLGRFTEMPAETVKVKSGTLVAGVEAPLASMIWEPAGEAGTLKVALQPPCALAVMPEARGLSSYVTLMPVSAAPNPAPVIVMELPGAALAGLAEIPALVVKVTSGTALAEVEEPEASMV